MYVGVDVGGTKTLLAVLNEHGEIVEEKQFPTPKTYDNFILELKNAYAHLGHQDYRAGAIGIPGRVDRRHGRGISLGNLSWKNFNIQHDTERILHCPIALENDAKLAGLSEYMLVKSKFNKILYLTLSTGIGYSLVQDGVIDISLGDVAGHGLMLEHNGKMMAWEDFASGRAILETYGQIAKDIHDQEIWSKYSRDVAQGLIQVIAITEPEAVIIGGSVGVYFDRYAKPLAANLKKYELPLITIPKLLQAQRPEKAVIFGCYDLAKQRYGHD